MACLTDLGCVWPSRWWPPARGRPGHTVWSALWCRSRAWWGPAWRRSSPAPLPADGTRSSSLRMRRRRHKSSYSDVKSLRHRKHDKQYSINYLFQIHCRNIHKLFIIYVFCDRVFIFILINKTLQFIIVYKNFHLSQSWFMMLNWSVVYAASAKTLNIEILRIYNYIFMPLFVYTDKH